MNLIQILLPLYDNRKKRFTHGYFTRVRQELTEQFGGLTTFTRTPAEGLWKKSARHVRRDDLVVFEVMTDRLNRAWWRKYRQELQKRFRQEVIVVRFMKAGLL